MKQYQRLLSALVITLFLSTSQSIAQDQKEIDFKNTCNNILLAFSNKSYSKVNNYINKNYGVYLKYRFGAYDRFTIAKKISDTVFYGNLSSPVLDWVDVSKSDLKKFALVYGKLPAYDCEKGRWSKKGYMADSLKKYKVVSEIVNFEIKYEERKFTRKELNDINYIEKNSRKIIFSGSKGEGAVFYMIYIGGKWYLSAIDESITDCSA